MSARRRSLRLTPESLRAYSRAGNFHSDPDAAREAGLPGLVAQGMQVAGPAYGALLDAWGEAFLARGELELKFVGMVVDGQTVDAAVTVEHRRATIEVVDDTGRVAVVGTATTPGGTR
jgi:acyl dehydratase